MEKRTVDLSDRIGAARVVGKATIPRQVIPREVATPQQLPKHPGRPERVLRLQRVHENSTEMAPADPLKHATYKSNAYQVEKKRSKYAQAVWEAVGIAAGIFALSAGTAEIVFNNDLHPHEARPSQAVDARGLQTKVPTAVQKRLGQSVTLTSDGFMGNGVKVDKNEFLTVQPEENRADCSADLVSPRRGGRMAVRNAQTVSTIGANLAIVGGLNVNGGLKPILSGVKAVEVAETASFEQGETIFTASGPDLRGDTFDRGVGVAQAGVVLRSPNAQNTDEAYVLMATHATRQQPVAYAGRGVYNAGGELEGMLQEGLSISKADAQQSFGIDLKGTAEDGWLTIAPVIPVTQATLAQAIPASGQSVC